MTTIGDRIKYKRLEKEISQEELADLLQTRYETKTHRVSVAKWENGVQEPRAYIIKALAEIFGTSVEWMLTGKDVSTISPNRRALLELAETATDEQISMLLRLAKAVLEQEK